MNILQIADAAFEDLAGGSRVVARELCRGLARRGHRVTLLVAALSGASPGVVEAGGVRIVRYAGAGRPAAFVRAGREACARLCAAERFDVAHVHFAYAAVGPRRALPPGTPTVRTFHGPWDAEGWVQESAAARGALAPLRYGAALVKRRMRYRVERADLLRAGAVSVLSDVFAREAIHRYGVAPERVVKIAGGVDAERFHPDPGGRVAARRRLGLPEEREILLCVRRLAARMGIDNLVDAMARVARARPGALLLIGGTGPEAEGLRRRVGDLGLAEQCRLMGFIPDDALVSYFQAADLFVLPTVALEGFGLVTVEALACGLPVVGTPVGGTQEILRPLDPALLTDGVAPADLARGVLAYLERPPALRHAPADLREHALRHYRWDAHVERTEALYRRVIEEGR